MQDHYAHRTSEMRTSDGAFVKIESHASLYSTAELAKEYASKGYPDKYVVFTDKQRSNRITGTKLADSPAERITFSNKV